MKLGFEAEFIAAVPELTSALYDRDLVGEPDMHSYHCGCNNCNIHDGYPLRVQHDSSCGGEVISNILTDWGDARSLFRAVQEAAVSVDAEPGLNAGFHVHSSVEDLSYGQKANIVRNFALWEPCLSVIAGGLWNRARRQSYSSGNQPVRDCLRPGIESYLGVVCGNNREWHDTLADISWPETGIDLFDEHYESNRHNNLNVNTGHGTFEFRLFNSTRTAWRMELFARLADAMTTPSIVSAMIRAADRPVSEHVLRVEELAEVMQDNELHTLSSLLFRQAEFRRGDKPLNYTDGGTFTIDSVFSRS